MSRAMSSYVWTEMAFHMTYDDGNGGQKDKKFARMKIWSYGSKDLVAGNKYSLYSPQRKCSYLRK
jgi:hypothetical protein